MKPQAKKPSAYFTIMGLTALTLLFSSSAWAQLRIVGAISGTVQDPTGAVIANASIVLKDAKTGITKETTSTERWDIPVSGFGERFVRGHRDGAGFSNVSSHRHLCFDKPDHGRADQSDRSVRRQKQSL